METEVKKEYRFDIWIFVLDGCVIEDVEIGNYTKDKTYKHLVQEIRELELFDWFVKFCINNVNRRDIVCFLTKRKESMFMEETLKQIKKILELKLTNKNTRVGFYPNYMQINEKEYSTFKSQKIIYMFSQYDTRIKNMYFFDKDKTTSKLITEFFVRNFPEYKLKTYVTKTDKDWKKLCGLF